MAGLSDAQCRDRLAKLIDTHPEEDVQHFARSALMWLSISQRPLRASELWLILLIEQSKDAEVMRRILTGSYHVNEQQAIIDLKELLGDMVSIDDDSLNDEGAYVSLRDSELLAVHAHPRDDRAAVQKVAHLLFTTQQAHLTAARACMTICSLTTLHPSPFHHENIASSLITYAWRNWSSHLSLTEHQLYGQEEAKAFDIMVSSVCTDVLVLLVGLGGFVTGLNTMPGIECSLECLAKIREAQFALGWPSTALCELVQQNGYSHILHNARSFIKKSKPISHDESVPLSSTRLATRHFVESVSKTEVLSMDQPLRSTLSLLPDIERRTLSRFTDGARGLIALCVALSQSPLYEALQREYGDWSPIDPLVNVANWMEAVASYPYRQKLRDCHSRVVYRSKDTNDLNSDPIRLIISRTKAPRVVSDPSHDRKDRVAARGQMPKPVDISNLRWRAAGVIYKLKAFGRQPTYSLDNPHLLSRRNSSFDSVTCYMHSPGLTLSFFQQLVRDALGHICLDSVTPSLNHLGVTEMTRPIDESRSGTFTVSVIDLWRQTRIAFHYDGYRTTSFQFAIAVLLHHVRRMLIPWLGGWIYYDPLEDLRLARGNPEVFLDEALDFTWSWLASMYIQKLIFDLLGSFLASLLVLNGGPRPPGFIAQTQERNRDLNNRLFVERLMSIAKVGYLMWTFACAEYMFDRTLSTFSFLLAYTKLYLLSPADSANRTALGLVLRKHWLNLPFNACQIVFYVVYGIAPMIWGAVLCAVKGRPGLLLVLGTLGGGVWILIRYRSRLFIALEMSSMFVAAGCTAVLFVLLAFEFIDDPLGIKVSTAAARRTRDAAKAVLSSKTTSKRLDIHEKEATVEAEPVSALKPV